MREDEEVFGFWRDRMSGSRLGDAERAEVIEWSWVGDVLRPPAMAMIFVIVVALS